jgi:hypothetical protein
MSEGNGPSPQVQYLRALGHDEAADALAAADALSPTPEPGTRQSEPAQASAVGPDAERMAEA